jgi:hypothetical protein
MVQDLTQPDAATIVYKAVEALGVEVDLLIAMNQNAP